MKVDGITGLGEIFDRDGRIEKPYWGPSDFLPLNVIL